MSRKFSERKTNEDDVRAYQMRTTRETCVSRATVVEQLTNRKTIEVVLFVRLPYAGPPMPDTTDEWRDEALLPRTNGYWLVKLRAANSRKKRDLMSCALTPKNAPNHRLMEHVALRTSSKSSTTDDSGAVAQADAENIEN
ncbi:hypothetical protein Y032_0597g453 [Ancylostoma ceylanicum]|uniref:Uncharacterized protein n=1 Tax=Ancylostoma ceylanicum TaxID=53326 RepID=A0A016WLT2_9BILA|nr:hypothetical protein Y032_0597g453 [Ancylostoma ceylanicum]